MHTGYVTASERRLFIACVDPNLFVAMTLHHKHAITVIRIADCFLGKEDESGNGADRRMCILYIEVVNLRLAIGIRTWSLTIALTSRSSCDASPRCDRSSPTEDAREQHAHEAGWRILGRKRLSHDAFTDACCGATVRRSDSIQHAHFHRSQIPGCHLKAEYLPRR